MVMVRHVTMRDAALHGINLAELREYLCRKYWNKKKIRAISTILN